MMIALLHWGWWVLIGGGAGVTIALIVSLAVLTKYVRIVVGILEDTPPPLSMGPVDFEKLHGELVNFRSLDGVSLMGMFLRGRHEDGAKGMVIFCHEFSADKYSCARYCRPLLEEGFDVFTFDFRGHGESSTSKNYLPRQWPTDKEVDDVLAACAFVESVLEGEGRTASVGLFGISRGAGAAIMAAEKNPAVKAILADSAFSSDTTIEDYMRRWVGIFARIRFIYENHPDVFYRLLRWLSFLFAQPKYNCRFPSTAKILTSMKTPPIFFIHGQRDSYIRQDQTKKLYELAPQPKFLWIVQGAKHNQSVVVQPDRYAERTVAFFERYLADIVLPTHDNLFASDTVIGTEMKDG